MTSTRSGQGVGFAIGDRARGTRVVVIFDARSPGGPLPFAFGVKGDFESGDATSRTAVLDRTWRGYQVNWQAAARGPRTSAYFWQSGGAAASSFVTCVCESRSRARRRVRPLSGLS